MAQANASGRVPVVFIHGLLLWSCDRWANLFEEVGYAPVSPGWPEDPDTVAEAAADPDVFADKPAVIGRSFGGLLAQIIAGARPRSPRPR